MNATRICSVEGCERKSEARELCNMHYIRFMKHGDVGTATPRLVRSVSGECSFKRCGRKHHAGGYCVTHYRQFKQGAGLRPIKSRLTPGAPLEARLAYLTVKGDGCWEWKGWKRAGYGVLYANGRKRSAHRVAYELEHGDIPDGMEIDHMCRNRGCVRVDHLQAVSRSLNAQNIGAQRNNSSGYRGVSRHVGRSGETRYVARAHANGKSFSGGYYDTPEEANRAAIALRNRVQANNREDWDEPTS